MEIKTITYPKVFITWIVIIVIQECNGEKRECKEGERTDWDQENRCFENKDIGIARNSFSVYYVGYEIAEETQNPSLL